ncbi:MAG TPA: hypothetical protein VN735_11875 [Steroidobacteraceae bacterium]|nr:hypothetical protein [Steroidobacteraceae bacterium]
MRSELRAVTWRAILITQSLGALFALYPWLEQWHRPGQPSLVVSLLSQSVMAGLVLIAALACDEAVRRGVQVWRAFAIVMLCASSTNVIGQWVIASGGRFEKPDALASLSAFMDVATYWGTGVMVYVNRRSAQRLLGRIRTGELDRVRAERRLTASRLAAAEVQIDPAAVLRELADARDLYASGHAGAEERIESLIARLRDSVGRSTPSTGGAIT